MKKIWVVVNSTRAGDTSYFSSCRKAKQYIESMGYIAGDMINGCFPAIKLKNGVQVFEYWCSVRNVI